MIHRLRGLLQRPKLTGNLSGRDSTIQGGMMSRTLLLVLASGLALHAPAALHAQDEMPARLDRFGDPLPAGVLTRLGTVRFRFNNYFGNTVKYSPDGRIIVTGGSDGVHLWDAATGKKIRQLPVHLQRSRVATIFAHDGKKLAVVAFPAQSVEVWDLETFEKVLISIVDAGDDWIGAAAFSSDDKTLVRATFTKL